MNENMAWRCYMHKFEVCGIRVQTKKCFWVYAPWRSTTPVQQNMCKECQCFCLNWMFLVALYTVLSATLQPNPHQLQSHWIMHIFLLYSLSSRSLFIIASAPESQQIVSPRHSLSCCCLISACSAIWVQRLALSLSLHFLKLLQRYNLAPPTVSVTWCLAFPCQAVLCVGCV